ncbi:GtrA family protein [Rahnella inusitata]|uniref:GtrA family protein n=1 Tax=Rahnella inusitata TaxID=58169 RepID=UPI0039AED151
MLAKFYNNQVIRYCAVGLANTIVTAIAILAMTVFGFGLYSANVIGYVIGILLSFALNTYFTFSAKPSLRILVKFMTCCLISYVINLISMKSSQYFGIHDKYAIQIIGMFFYTTSGFLINKLWVMK